MERPGGADAEAFNSRVALMRESSAGWRRGTFGFGFTLFRRP